MTDEHPAPVVPARDQYTPGPSGDHPARGKADEDLAVPITAESIALLVNAERELQSAHAQRLELNQQEWSRYFGVGPFPERVRGDLPKPFSPTLKIRAGTAAALAHATAPLFVTEIRKVERIAELLKEFRGSSKYLPQVEQLSDMLRFCEGYARVHGVRARRTEKGEHWPPEAAEPVFPREITTDQHSNAQEGQ